MQLDVDVIYNQDCLEGMKSIPDKSIDMILCDLPYGVTQNKKDVALPFKELWEQYERIVKDNAAILLFAQGMFYVNLVNSNKKLFRYDLIWDKQLTTGFLNANRMPLRKHEQIAVFYKKLPTYNPQFTKGKPLHSKGNMYQKKAFVNRNYGEFELSEDYRSGSTEKYPSSILNFQKPHPSKVIHPTQKPITLLEYLIKTYTNESEIVLDNAFGSGSTLIAAFNTNRHYIGFELDENYFDIACDRLDAAEREREREREQTIIIVLIYDFRKAVRA